MARGGLLVIAAMMLAGAAMAAPSGGPAHDADKPIDFTADRLDVRRDDHVAAFIGHVEVVQGDLTLNADEVKVVYRETPDDKKAGGFAGAVSRIDAQGHVRLASPKESATGDWGVYDVDKRIITLGGAVVLKRDGNVIRGQRLEFNLDTGRSRIDGAPGAATPDRVHGVFTPSRKEPK